MNNKKIKGIIVAGILATTMAVNNVTVLASTFENTLIERVTILNRAVEIGEKIDQKTMTVSASTSSDGNIPEKVLDGLYGDGDETIWHSEWRNNPVLTDQWIKVELNESQYISAVEITPRRINGAAWQTGHENGVITKCKVIVISNGVEVDMGEHNFSNTDTNRQPQKIEFNRAIKAEAVKIIPLATLRNHQYASIAELNVYKAANQGELQISDIQVTGDNEVGKEKTIVTTATGEGALEYRYSVYTTATGWKALGDGDFSASKVMNWTPERIGGNLVRVEVRDASGKVITRNKWFDFENNNVTIDNIVTTENLQAGQEATISIEGLKTDSTKYTVEVYTTSNNWSAIASDVVANADGVVSVKWTPEKYGENKLRITAADSTGKIVVSEKWVTVNNDELNIAGLVTGEYKVGSVGEVAVAGTINENLKDSTEYKLEVYNTTLGWKTIGEASGVAIEDAKFEWTPEVMGENLLRLTVKDSSGKIVISKANVNAYGLNIPSGLQAGFLTTINAVVKNTNAISYSLDVYNTTEGWSNIISNVIADENGRISLPWTPSKQGENLIRITVKLANGKVITHNKWVTVNNDGLQLTGFITDGDLQVGDNEVITLEGTVNTALVNSTEYKLEVYNTTQGWKTIAEDSKKTMESVVLNWIPEKIGQNLVRVTVKDSSGKVIRYNEWVTVNNDALSLDDITISEDLKVE